MVKFIFGLVAIIVAVGAAYYYLTVKPITDAQPTLQPSQQGAAAKAEVRTNPIPPGAVMEDGTLPE